LQTDRRETAASYDLHAALREGFFGNPKATKQRATAALALSKSRNVQYGTAFALALAGEDQRSEALTDDLARQFPQDTIVNVVCLPVLRALLALKRNDAAHAIELLQTAIPYELGGSATLYPAYVRGEAYLAVGRAAEAAAEFQKILDHRGIVIFDPIGALAHLQIARAYTMAGDTAKAKGAYKDFPRLWKDADSDIPILKQAKAEYAKLQ
jgi:eukaryotic-like serine/threonine-protein kinase